MARRAGGFSQHAGIDIQPGQRAKLERLCRHVSRPPVATERLALTASGQVRYQLKTPNCDGTSHIASIEVPAVIARILAHLEKTAGDDSRPKLVPRAARAPPAQLRLI